MSHCQLCAWHTFSAQSAVAESEITPKIGLIYVKIHVI